MGHFFIWWQGNLDLITTFANFSLNFYIIPLEFAHLSTIDNIFLRSHLAILIYVNTNLSPRSCLFTLIFFFHVDITLIFFHANVTLHQLRFSLTSFHANLSTLIYLHANLFTLIYLHVNLFTLIYLHADIYSCLYICTLLSIHANLSFSFRWSCLLTSLLCSHQLFPPYH